MENIKNIEETILTYTSAWNETERGAIAEKIKKYWAPEGTYTDKITDTITGQDAIIDLIVSSYGQMGPKNIQSIRRAGNASSKRPLFLAGHTPRGLPGSGHGLF